MERTKRSAYAFKLGSGFGLARQKSSLSVSEPDTPSGQAILERSVLSLKEFDDDKLMADEPSQQPSSIET